MEGSDRSLERLLVCQNRTCRKQGSAEVLAAFRDSSADNATGETPAVPVEGSACLGQCGNGPMVLVLPEEVWYCGVRVEEVPVIVERHLLGGVPVKGMLYRKFHPVEKLK
ncbi:MAG: (2Fe-2S) ferredoxin domain-containing protein [Cyanobacteriota bacterium]|nr:(2Fe-2S) ferredoxin domain-containing protein [Cyanobacteriota bacterium]